MAFLVGVGAAAAIGGAVFGTLFPQALAAMNVFGPQAGTDALDWVVGYWNAGVMLVGTLSTLAYFHFGARPRQGVQAQRPLWLRVIALVGQFFIAVTFGALFAGVYAAALVALVERLNFLLQFILTLISP